MAEQPPPYPGEGSTKQPLPPDYPVQPSYAPQPTPGYPPQPAPGYPPQPMSSQPGPAYPVQPPPAAWYPPQPAGGYPPQPMQGQPGHPQAGYGQKAYAPGYQPQPQGYVQQPAMINNTNTTVVVTQQPTVTATVIPYVNDYMGLSIFSCLACCWCIGCFAIMKSSEARNHFNAGNYTQAMSSALTARNLSYASIFCGIGTFVLIIIIISAT